MRGVLRRQLLALQHLDLSREVDPLLVLLVAGDVEIPGQPGRLAVTAALARAVDPRQGGVDLDEGPDLEPAVTSQRVAGGAGSRREAGHVAVPSSPGGVRAAGEQQGENQEGRSHQRHLDRAASRPIIA